MRKRAILSLILLLTASSLAPSVTRLVPDDYPNIQAAIDDANDGDEIVISEGIYTGPGNRDITFQGKRLTVRSTDPNDPNIVAATIIDGQHIGGHRGFTVGLDGEANSVIDGLSVVGFLMDSSGGGIACASGVTIRNCIISGNFAAVHGGGVGGEDFRLVNCTVTSNSAASGGGVSGGRITGCVISGNTADHQGGGVAGALSVSKSMITANFAEYGGGGISYVPAFGNGFVEDSIISGNTAEYDGGGLLSCLVPVRGCLITGNMAGRDGGGISDCNGPIVNCTITGNTADNRGGGIYCAAGIIIDNSLVAGNASDTGGGIYSHDGTNLIENCTFAANKAADTGGGLYFYFPSGYSWPYDVPPEFEGLPWGREIPPPPTGPAAYSNILNSIFWDNTAQSGPQIAAESAYTPVPPSWPPSPPSWPSPEPPDWPDWMDRFRNPTGLSDESTQLILTDWPYRPLPTPPDWPGWPFPIPPEFPWPPNLPWPPTPPELPSPPPQPPHPRVITIKYSDVAGGQENVHTDSQWLLIWGAGNADTDPCFVEPGYFDSNDVWVHGDYHLLGDSPCIDAGDPNYVPEPNETDLDGRPRVLDGNEDGIAAIDMGAYEYTPPIPAEIDINPDNLNLRSKGKWIMCVIWLPEDYNVADIDANSVLLEDEIPAERVWLTDEFAVAKFSRSALQELLSDLQTPAEVELLVSGELTDGTTFEGTDTIKLTDRRRKQNSTRPPEPQKHKNRK